jgi:hypothetical protein
MYNLSDFIYNTNIVDRMESTMTLVTRDKETGEQFRYTTAPNTKEFVAYEEAYQQYKFAKEIDAKFNGKA